MTQMFEKLQKCPNMQNRSREEVYYHCRWLARLGMLTMNRLVDALNEGDRRGLMDACFVGLPGVPDHASEYDGGYYHKEARLLADVAKTHRMLDYKDLLVLRVRVGAAHLPMQNERVIVVHVSKPQDAVDAMSQEFAKHIVDPSMRSRLLSHQKDTEVDRVAHDFLMWADAEYKVQVESLSSKVGVIAAQRLLRVHGIKSRLAGGSVIRILDRLMGAPYSVKKLETFMCNGVAARFGDEDGLFRILDRLMGAPYSVKKLETFMCGGVAARLHEQSFLEALTRLPILNKARAAELCKSFPLAKRARTS